jgi:hypothetical protein
LNRSFIYKRIWALVIRSYGARIGLVQDQSVSQQNLIRLLKALKTHLKQKTVTTSLLSSSSSTTGIKTAASSTTNTAIASLIAAVDNSGNRLSMLNSPKSIEVVNFVARDFHNNIYINLK